LVETVKSFQGSLEELEEVLGPYLKSSRADLQATDSGGGLTAAEKAKLDCLAAFTLNSLVWVWLRTKGLNPKETEVKGELERVKKSMIKLKEVQDKDKRQKVDQGAAKRLVASGIWNPGEAKKRHQNSSTAAAAASSSHKKSKRN